MRTINTAFGPVQLLSISQFLKLVYVKTTNAETLTLINHKQVPIFTIQRENAIPEEPTYTRTFVELVRMSKTDKIKAVRNSVTSIEPVTNRSLISFMEMIIDRCIYHDNTLYLVRIDKRTWAAVNTDYIERWKYLDSDKEAISGYRPIDAFYLETSLKSFNVRHPETILNNYTQERLTSLLKATGKVS